MKYFEAPNVLLLKKYILELSKEKKVLKDIDPSFFTAIVATRHILPELLPLVAKDYLHIENIRIQRYYLEAINKLHAIFATEKSVETKEHTNNENALKHIIDNQVPVTLDKFQEIRKDEGERIEDYITFDIKFSKKGTAKLEKDLKRYIADFMNDEVVSRYAENHYSYYPQKREFKRTLGYLANDLGSAKNLLFSINNLWENTAEFVKNSQKYREAIHKTTFLETVLAMEKEGLIKITGLISPESVRVTILPNNIAEDDFEDEKGFNGIARWQFTLAELEKEAKNRLVEVENRTISWKDLILDKKTGNCEYKKTKVIHRFYQSKPQYWIVNELILAKGKEITHNQFINVLQKKKIPDIPQSIKKQKAWINQKVRDIRKSLGINRKQNPTLDIFLDTGNGYRLEEINLSKDNLGVSQKTT